jgi:hypothetical protein
MDNARACAVGEGGCGGSLNAEAGKTHEQRHAFLCVALAMSCDAHTHAGTIEHFPAAHSAGLRASGVGSSTVPVTASALQWRSHCLAPVVRLACDARHQTPGPPSARLSPELPEGSHNHNTGADI